MPHARRPVAEDGALAGRGRGAHQAAVGRVSSIVPLLYPSIRQHRTKQASLTLPPHIPPPHPPPPTPHSDRRGSEFCLGPTHEEAITSLVAGALTSYKQLPWLLYQLDRKFRDEVGQGALGAEQRR